VVKKRTIQQALHLLCIFIIYSRIILVTVLGNFKCLWTYLTCGSHLQGSKGVPGSPGPVGPPVSHLIMTAASFLVAMNQQNNQDWFFNYIWLCHLNEHSYNNIIINLIFPYLSWLYLNYSSGSTRYERDGGAWRASRARCKWRQNDYYTLNAQHLFIKCTSVYVT